MSNIPVLVVDDEPLARQKICRLLAQSGHNFDILEAGNGLEALSILDGQMPDILFLDIEMPGLSGFEVLYHLDQRPFKIIFQTAFDEFALKAFEVNACDYILKPYTPERFTAALNKALQQIDQEQKILDLEKFLVEESRYLEHISVKDNGTLIVINVDDIACFVSRDHYTCIYASGREFLTKLSLDHLIERLDPGVFCRTHRNSLVCLKAVRKLNGSSMEMLSGHVIEVSRRHRKQVQEWLKSANI